MTRCTHETKTLISQLIASMEDDKGLDILGVPLTDSQKMKEIWENKVDTFPASKTQRVFSFILELAPFRRVVWSCQSIDVREAQHHESFHLHMKRFILGKCM